MKLGKAHKLCSKRCIDRLFAAPGASAMCYPLRAVWAENEQRNVGETLQFVIIVPKKKLHRAVDRVKMRRRIREAYRLNLGTISLDAETAPKDVAFIYIGDTLQPYARVHRAMQKLLVKITSTSTASISATSVGSATFMRSAAIASVEPGSTSISATAEGPARP